MAEKFEYTREWTDAEAFPLLGFTKSWENPEDYPTIELDETQVRKDMQSLHDEVKDYINTKLIPAVLAEDATEEARAAAEAQRETNEAQRIENENARITAEQARVDETNGVVAQAAKQAENAAESARLAAQAILGQIPDGTLNEEKLEQSVQDAIDRAKAGGSIDEALSNKAPAGFGLGNAGELITDCNTAGLNGWYHIESGGLNSPDSSLGWTIFTTTPYNEATPIQDAWSFPNTKIYYHLRRFVYPGGGTPWEWVNPPMLLGVEYRTTERYLGKPVYVQVVDCGTIPAQGTRKDLVFSPDAESIVSVTAYSPIRGNTLPYYDANGVRYAITGSGNTVMIWNYSEPLLDTNVLALIKYTKTTD